MEEAICWGQIWKEKVPGPSWNGNRDLWKGEAQKHFWHLLHLNKYQILCVFPLRVLVALQLSPLFASVFQKPQGGIEGVRDCYQISWSRTYKGSEDSVKTVAKSNRGRKWESQFQCDSKSPICEEDIITPFLQLLSHLPWPTEWSLPDSTTSPHWPETRVWMAQVNKAPLSLSSVLSIFVIIPFMLLSSLLSTPSLPWWSEESWRS